MLLNAGWEVQCLGLSSPNTASLCLPSHPRLHVHLAAPVALKSLQKLQYLLFCLRAMMTAIWSRPTLIYASDPLSTPAAMAAKMFNRGGVCVYHEHDAPQLPKSIFQRIVDRLRGVFSRQALRVVVPNSSRADRLIAATSVPPERVAIVFNCASTLEISKSNDTIRTRRDDERIWLHFHGSLAPDKLPLHIIDALCCLPAHVCLRVIGYEAQGSEGFGRKLVARARELKVESRLEVFGQLDRVELLEKTRQSHIGLSLMPKFEQADNFNMQHMAGASNKPFDYLACGCPLIVSDLPDWRSLFVDAGVAIACDPSSLESIVCAIRGYLDNPARYEHAQSIAHRLMADTWNYEAQFAPVLRHISVQNASNAL